MARRMTRKRPEDLEKMRAAGRVVRQVLDAVGQMCQPGVTLRELDEAARRIIAESGGKGLFKGYPASSPGVPPFPGYICASVNEVVVHGIPDDRVIQEGDIVGVDCGVQLDGWCGDSAYTFMVGEVTPEVRRLCQVTQEVLQVAIDNIQPGRNWSTVARLMEKKALDAGYGVVEDFVGHGIGRSMHEAPQVPNYVSRDLVRNDIMLTEGMVLAIEPMCNLGSREVRTTGDGWTVVTVDGKAAAHYEHTVAVTANGADVLTDGR